MFLIMVLMVFVLIFFPWRLATMRGWLPETMRPSARRPCPSPRRPSRSRGPRRARGRCPTPRRRRRPAGPWWSTSRRRSAACLRRSGCGRTSGTRRGVGLLRAAGAEGALVHLAAGAEVARLRELRRAEGAGVEAVAAADAEVLGVQHHAFLGLVEAVHRADRHAGRVRAVHAGHRDRALAGLAVVDGHHRRRLMPQGTSCSFLQAVTQALHSMQRSASQRNFIHGSLVAIFVRFLLTPQILQRVALVSCIWVTES
jgi:hypothetical protein